MAKPAYRGCYDVNDKIFAVGITGGRDAGYSAFGRDRSGSAADAMV